MQPLTRYRPTNVDGGDGTFTQSLSSPATIYGVIEVHDTETRLITDALADIAVGDIVLADAANYRVIGRTEVLGAPRLIWQLERTELPVTPV